MTDARFEDGREAPLNLGALDAEDLAVIASLTQDAVFPGSEMKWDRANRRFALLINRFRWEDPATQSRAPERVQSVLVFDTVLGVQTSGVMQRDAETVLSLLDIGFDGSEAPAGFITLTLAGDGAVRLQVEAVEVNLRDVTRPYAAPSGKTPGHRD
jgi:hypothetical protein